MSIVVRDLLQNSASRFWRFFEFVFTFSTLWNFSFVFWTIFLKNEIATYACVQMYDCQAEIKKYYIQWHTFGCGVHLINITEHGVFMKIVAPELQM